MKSFSPPASWGEVVEGDEGGCVGEGGGGWVGGGGVAVLAARSSAALWTGRVAEGGGEHTRGVYYLLHLSRRMDVSPRPSGRASWIRTRLPRLTCRAIAALHRGALSRCFPVRRLTGGAHESLSNEIAEDNAHTNKKPRQSLLSLLGGVPSADADAVVVPSTSAKHTTLSAYPAADGYVLSSARCRYPFAQAWGAALKTGGN